MATAINDETTEDSAVLTVSRKLAGPPWRSADRTWTDLCHYLLAMLQQRAFPDVSQVTAAFQSLSPLGRQWVIQHVFEHDGLIFTTNDLHLQIRVTYQAEPDEDLSPLPVELLDELPADAPMTLQVPSVSRTNKTAVDSMIAAVAEHGVIVRFAFDTEADIAKEQPDGHDAQ